MTKARWRALFFRWIKFSAVGWLGVGVQLTTLTLLASYGNVHYLVATALAVESAIVHNFFWHEHWTWKDRELRASSGRLRRLVRFNFAAGAISITGNLLFMRFFVGELGLPIVLGNLASIASCALLNFAVSHKFVFLNFDDPGLLEEPAACE